MTTKRRTAADPNLLDYTLDDFSTWLHAHPDYAAQLAGGARFADAVYALADAKAALAQVKTVSDTVYADMRAAWAATETDPAARRVGTKELKLVGVREQELVRSVDSKIVRKDHNAAWDASRIIKPYVSVSSKAVRDLVEVDGLDALYPQRTHDVAVLLDARAAITDLRKPFTAAEESAKARLDEIAAITGWDGQVRTFLDGWKVQTTVKQFDADKFAQEFPELFDALAEEKLGGGNVGRLEFGPVKVEQVDLDGDEAFTGMRTVRRGGMNQQQLVIGGELDELGEINGD